VGLAGTAVALSANHFIAPTQQLEWWADLSENSLWTKSLPEMPGTSADVALDILQILEKGTSAIPIAGGFLSSAFGIASVVTQKTQDLKKCPEVIRELARDIQDFLLTFEQYSKEYQFSRNTSSDFTSTIFEIEQYVQTSFRPRNIYWLDVRVLTSLLDLLEKRPGRFKWMYYKKVEEQTTSLRSRFDEARRRLEVYSESLFGGSISYSFFKAIMLLDTKAALLNLELIQAKIMGDLAEIRQTHFTHQSSPPLITHLESMLSQDNGGVLI
jgi:hypothetical protein